MLQESRPGLNRSQILCTLCYGIIFHLSTLLIKDLSLHLRYKQIESQYRAAFTLFSQHCCEWQLIFSLNGITVYERKCFSTFLLFLLDERVSAAAQSFFSLNCSRVSCLHKPYNLLINTHGGKSI